MNSKIYPKMNKENTALIIIDVVNSCAHEKCETPEWNIRFSKIREMVPRLDIFIKDYRKVIQGEVVFVNLSPWDKEHLRDNMNELYTDSEVTYYSDDRSGFSEEFYKIRPKNGDTIITKNTYDAFSQTKLEEILKKKGIQYLIITGVFTGGCVLATVVVGFSLGFNFVMLKDLIEATDSEENQRLSNDIKNRIFPYLYGKTITSKELLDSWGK
jgi:nicotinamidase-related amidase